MLAQMPSKKHQFSDKDAEIEHLRTELEIYKQKDLVLADLQR